MFWFRKMVGRPDSNWRPPHPQYFVRIQFKYLILNESHLVVLFHHFDILNIKPPYYPQRSLQQGISLSYIEVLSDIDTTLVHKLGTCCLKEFSYNFCISCATLSMWNQVVSEHAVLTHLDSIITLFYAIFYCLPELKLDAHWHRLTLSYKLWVTPHF